MKFLKKMYKQLIVVAVAVYALCIFVSQQKMMNNYDREIKNYNAQIAEQKVTKEELIEMKDNLNSTEYIEQIARDKLGMYLPNERVYIDVTK